MNDECITYQKTIELYLRLYHKTDHAVSKLYFALVISDCSVKLKKIGEQVKKEPAVTGSLKGEGE